MERKNNKKDVIKRSVLSLILVGVLIVLLLNFISSQEVSYCCEKLKSGAWCQNAPKESCDISIDVLTGSPFRSISSSCDVASYCRLGYCIDSIEGTCSENTPERVCQNEGGVWKDNREGTPPQCNLGCCLLNDQAAFVPLTRCKRLSSLYGLETNYRSDITNEVECIASATSDVKGACVYEKEFQKLCKLTTQKECSILKGSSNIDSNSSVSFHPGYLCTDENLNTICGPSKTTTCVQGRDEVYFTDTCGNIANIYDASKIDDKVYWSKIVSRAESCNPDSANVGSSAATCGNCDYFLGSTCKSYNSGKDNVRPNYGNFVCRDLSCDFEDKKYQHGETWCADSKGIDKSLPGSRYYRLLCYNGEVTIEPCEDFRQEVCLQANIDGFKVAACRANMWQDCFAQLNRKDCENIDKRDCEWFPGIRLASERKTTSDTATTNTQPFSTTTTPPFTGSVTGNAVNDPLDEENRRIETEQDTNGACLPSIAPGFNFWEQGGDAQSMCALANKECIVKYSKGTLGKWKCEENCECVEDSWELQQNNLCTAIGDCGNSKNYIEVQGYNTGYKITSEKIKDD